MFTGWVLHSILLYVPPRFPGSVLIWFLGLLLRVLVVCVTGYSFELSAIDPIAKIGFTHGIKGIAVRYDPVNICIQTILLSCPAITKDLGLPNDRSIILCDGQYFITHVGSSLSDGTFNSVELVRGWIWCIGHQYLWRNFKPNPLLKYPRRRRAAVSNLQLDASRSALSEWVSAVNNSAFGLKSEIGHHPSTFAIDQGIRILVSSLSRSFLQRKTVSHCLGSFGSLSRLIPYRPSSYSAYEYERPIGPLNGCIPFWCFLLIVLCYGSGALITIHCHWRWAGHIGLGLVVVAVPIWFLGRVLCEAEHDQRETSEHSHNGEIVPRKYLTNV